MKAKNPKKILALFYPVALLLSILACSNVGYQVIDNDEKLLSELPAK